MKVSKSRVFDTNYTLIMTPLSNLKMNRYLQDHVVYRLLRSTTYFKKRCSTNQINTNSANQATKKSSAYNIDTT